MGHQQVCMHKTTYKCLYACPPALGKAGCCAAEDDTTPHDTSHHPMKMDYYATNWVPRTTRRSYGRRQELIRSYHTYGEDEPISRGFGTVHRTNIEEEATSLKL